MDKDFRIFKLKKELDELENEKFRSDQENERMQEIKEELALIRAQTTEKLETTDEKIPDVDYDDINLDDKELDQLIESINPETADKHTLRTLKKAVALKKERIKTLKELKQLEQEAFEAEIDLEDLKKEKNFMQGKKNPDGTIPFRENVYQRKLKEAKTPRQRLALKFVKIQTKMHNAMIIGPKKISKAAESISEFSNAMGKMGDQFAQYGGYSEPRKQSNENKKHKKSKKKGKKRKHNSDNGNDQDNQDDNSYGFDTKKVFDRKFTW